MRVYLDTSVLNRVFDDQAQARIALETQALRMILQVVEMGDVELVNSSVLEFEAQKNPYPARQRWVRSCLALAKVYVPMSREIIARGKALEEVGVKAVDALHVASAEAVGCDYFLACDDRLLRRYDGKVKGLNPASFILLFTGEG
ncbi:PIN domain-containing protein [Picosynechococcus sp. PCC 73109]|uniref:type II toxin-antitoxin system VapC family toxin n=1 Tax=Picosynechococcus sp. PCC 73109 TaxID=374982 RepID=UPI0007459663|nr:PIN domain-containing protein [Picosynechococcus sp. PCC 73109]